MGGSTSSVEIVSRRLVRPELASSADRMSSEPEVIHLTPWDLTLITVDHIQKGILLPKPQTGGAQVIDNLASSFARTLGRFYPFAGRLTASEITNGMSSPSLIISLCCNNEGAEFVHAMAPGVSVRDITTSLYTPSVVWSFFPLNRLLSVDAAMDSLPVLSAQVTELADGIFIGMSLNHGVADGTAFWRFFNTWSEINRSSSGSEGCKLSTPPPVLDRWFLDTCPVPIPLPFGKLEDIIRRPEYTPVQECFFHFSAESIKRLKTKANAEMAGTATATISSLQSLLAHLWRAVCRARELAPHMDTTYKLAVGFRGRVKGIPQEYIGNAMTVNDIKSTAGDVLERGLGWTAWLLNRTVASFDEATVMGRLASWAKDPRLAYVEPSIWRDAARILTGSSPRFDVYGNDFGWGRLVAVRSGAATKLDGKVTVYEGRGGGGSMALEVCLSAEALARLIADEEFMEAVSAA